MSLYQEKTFAINNDVLEEGRRLGMKNRLDYIQTQDVCLEVRDRPEERVFVKDKNGIPR